MKLSETEAQCLRAWQDIGDLEMSYLSFRSIELSCGVPRGKIRRTVRALARKGMVRYAFGLWSDCGDPRGSGYGLTEAGAEKLEKMSLNHSEEQ